MKTQLREIRQLVADDKLEIAIAKMEQLPVDVSLKNTILQLSSRLTNVTEQEHNDIISSADFQLEQNKIRKTILEITANLLKEAGETEEGKTGAPVPFNESQIQFLVNNQKKSIQFYLILVAMMVAFGALIVWFGWSLQEESFKTISNFGGVFVASLSSFPIHKIIRKNEIIGILGVILLKSKSGEKHYSQLDDIVLKKIEKLLIG